MMSDKAQQAEGTALVVDLDGSLVATDTFIEGILALVRHAPSALPGFITALCRGRAAAKAFVAEHVSTEAAHLPYREEVLSLLREARNQRRPTILATAAHERTANSVAAHLRLFDVVIATTEDKNRKGTEKLAAIREHLGGRKFAYVGDSSADIPIWQAADERIVIASKRRSVVLAQGFTADSVIHPPTSELHQVFRALRVHQWVKNILIFVPLVMAHRLTEFALIRQSLLAFFAFSFSASAVYVINDLFDLSADRQHPKKRRRPFASGRLSVKWGLVLPLLLFSASLLFAATLPSAFLVVLGIYIALTFGYSLALKQIVLVDIMVLAALYTIRLMAGGAAVTVPVSQWLLAFSMFFFLSLACVKRYSELLMLQTLNREKSGGRGYLVSDREQVAHLGTASGYISVLVLALYINSEEVRTLYHHPSVLWFICPFLLYWVSRVWMLAHRGQLHEDPIVFALRDRASYIIGAIAALLLWVGV